MAKLSENTITSLWIIATPFIILLVGFLLWLASDALPFLGTIASILGVIGIISVPIMLFAGFRGLIEKNRYNKK